MNEFNIYWIKDYDKKDVADISAAFNMCYSNKITDLWTYKQWNNKLNSSPFGNAISVIAKNDDEICGVISFGNYNTLMILFIKPIILKNR